MQQCSKLILLILTFVLMACSSDMPAVVDTIAPADVSDGVPKPNPLILSMATTGDWSLSFKGTIMEQQLEKLETKSNEQVKIKLYDRSRLGDETHLITGVQLGTIDIVQSSPSAQIVAVPEAALLDIPGLFGTLDEWNMLFKSEYRREMEGYYRDAGLELIDVFAFSWRHLSSKEPVHTLADLQDMRIRTMQNKYHEEFWDSLGAVAVPYRFAELYFCLYEGMADAQENLLDAMLAENLIDVQQCVTRTRHLPMVSTIVMNKEKYDSLSGTEKQHIHAFAEDLRTHLIAQIPENEEKLIETLDNDYGILILSPSQDLQQEIVKGKDIVLDLLKQELGAQKVASFLEAVAEVSLT